MIGIGPLASAAGGVLVVAGLVGAGGPDPATAVRADEIVRERRAESLAALDAVAELLRASLESGRGASDAVLAGSEGAGEHLIAAADSVDVAGDEARAARDAIGALAAARRVRGDASSSVAAPISDAELGALAEELRLAAPAADGAAELRRGANALLEQLDRALAAAVEGDHVGARAEVDGARANHRTLAASSTASDVLPVWLDATDAMINAVTSLIDAAARGDREAASAAAADFATVAEGAATADRALRIAIAEAADAATAAPLARLAAAISAVEAVRGEIERENRAP